MFAAALIWFKSKSVIMYGLIAVAIIAAMILLPGLDQIREYLGMETRSSLKIELQQQQQQMLDIQNSNRNLQATIIETAHLQQQIDEAIVLQDQVTKVAETATAETIVTKHTAIQHIRTVSRTNVGYVSQVATETAISKVQISALWVEYCKGRIDSRCAV